MPQYQGVWTLQDAARLQSTQQWATDPSFDYTTLLLQADNAPNGAQNNTFLDSSSNNFTITRNGNTTQGTFSPYGSNWSNFFNSVSDVLTTPSNTALSFGTGDFCIEAFFYPLTNTAPNGIFANGAASAGSIGFYTNSSGKIELAFYGGSNVNGASTVSANVWNHIVATRSGTTVRVFLNGVLDGTSTISFNNTSSTGYIGSFWGGSSNSYISNLRVCKGAIPTTYQTSSTTVGASIFTPPTATLSTTSQGASSVSLLTCQSNRFVDNSSNAFALTAGGTPSVQAFSPFAPQYQYTPSVTGGSGYFDGTGDYLTLSGNTNLALGSGNFTIELWVNITSFTTYGTFATTYNNTPVAGTWFLRLNASTQQWQWQNGSDGGAPNFKAYNSSTNLIAGAWHHLAVVRSSGVVTLYQDGVNVGGGTDVETLVAPTFWIGQTINGYPMNGYISNLRVLKGTAQYTAAFTPPTAPLTAITNTQLLTNFTNAGIYDGTMKNNLETVGNAQVSTSVVKYGTGSMAFDGSGDYCLMQNTPNLRLASTEAFTVEFWVYANALSSDQHVIHAYGLVSPFSGWAFGFGSGGVANTTLAFYDGTTWRNVGTGFVTGNWYHIAVTSQGASSTGRFFVNGAQQGSSVTFASTITNSVAPIAIGSQSNGSFSFNGYLDDLRITKGIARYTANFTPPTVALPRQ